MPNYLEGNEDFKNFLDKVSDITGDKFKQMWRDNLRTNYELFKTGGWATEKLQEAEKGKTAILMGASPALSKQLDTLREIQHDPDFILCGLSCNLEFLLNNGVRPKYVITVDADPTQGDFFNNIDMGQTESMTLIAATTAYPPMLKKWKGPLHFIALEVSDKKLHKIYRQLYGPLNGIGRQFFSLMGQFNVMMVFIFLCLCCKIILFVGNELSFATRDSKYYVDREDPRDRDAKHAHGDIYGNIVYTTTGLMALKLSLEYFTGLVAGAGFFFNCTEAGIFGITKRYPDYHVPWIHQLTLKNGIAQARHIMRTGEPFYLN